MHNTHRQKTSAEIALKSLGSPHGTSKYLSLLDHKDVQSSEYFERAGLTVIRFVDGSCVVTMPHRRPGDRLLAVDVHSVESLCGYAEWLRGSLPSQIEWINECLELLNAPTVSYEKKRFSFRRGKGASTEDILKAYINDVLWGDIPEDINPNVFFFCRSGVGFDVSVYGEVEEFSFRIFHEDLLVWIWSNIDSNQTHEAVDTNKQT